MYRKLCLGAVRDSVWMGGREGVRRGAASERAPCSAQDFILQEGGRGKVGDWSLAEPDPPGRLGPSYPAWVSPDSSSEMPSEALLHQSLHFYKMLPLGEAE